MNQSGLASCTGCRNPLAGDNLLRDAAAARLKTVAEWRPEHFDQARRAADARIETARAERHQDDWQGPRTRLNAVHEAAHAVVALSFGASIRKLNIDGSLMCEHDGQVPSETALATVSLAGLCAEQRDTGIRSTEPALAIDFFIRAARCHHRGWCDGCTAMKALLRDRPASSDIDLEARYRAL